MLNLDQFRTLVVRPTLQLLAAAIPYTLAAEDLVIGTALHESDLCYLAQQKGPALGLWQMEPATYKDIRLNFMPGQPKLQGLLFGMSLCRMQDPAELVWNLQLACAMARVQYFRSPKPIPQVGDAMGMAQLYKDVYNTAAGAASVAQVFSSFQAAVSEDA